MASKCFVHGVIDNLLSKVVGASSVGIHTRALAHGFKSREDFDIFGGILAHS
jgi:hypothetical protein